jgi:molybdate transport system substrate-binding protein
VQAALNRKASMKSRALVVALLGMAMGSSLGTGGDAFAKQDPPKRELVVFEAASLKHAFGRLAKRFEAENPGVTVIANAAGSQELRAQIEHGAAVDVLASADRKTMDALAAQHLVSAPVIFTCNEPVMVVRTKVASTLRAFADLPRAERIVVGAPEVPIGGYTNEILRRAGADFAARVEARVVSRELNVRQVLAKVTMGEADAGIVYRSDAVLGGDAVRTVDVPAAFKVTAEYPIAVVAAAPHAELARRFVALVMSPAGTEALREAGFVPCPKR